MTHSKEIEKAKTLIEALPYIKRFHGQTLVIKYGGSLMEDENFKRRFATDVVLLKYVGINPIIVHGGGKEISKWMNKSGKEAKFIDGLRYTDAETMEITEMVLSGKINSDVVSLINQSGGKAIGLSGKDSKLLLSEQIKSKNGEDLGFVGEIKKVYSPLLKTLTHEGYIPVVSCIGVSEEGMSLNLNADHAASAVAVSMNALKLIYMTDVEGILRNGELISSLNLSEAETLLSHPDIKGGMLPKLDCSIDAVKGGVQQVHILNGSTEHAILLEIFTDQGVGTMVTRDR